MITNADIFFMIYIAILMLGTLISDQIKRRKSIETKKTEMQDLRKRSKVCMRVRPRS